jgi:gliding motility-associated-like protein
MLNAKSQTSSSFKINYDGGVRMFSAYQYIGTADNGTVIAGKWAEIPVESTSDLLLIKIDKVGKLVWNKKVALKTNMYNYNLCEISDGSIVLAATIGNNVPPYLSTMLLVKVDCKGEGLWSKTVSMKLPTGQEHLTTMSVKEGKSGDMIISFFNSENDGRYAVVARINSSGNLVWSKRFIAAEFNASYMTTAFYKNDKIFVFGRKRMFTNFYDYDKFCYAMRLNYDDGNVEQTVGYNYSEFRTNRAVLQSWPKRHFNVEQLSKGGFALFGVFHNFNVDYYCFSLIVNDDLSIRKSNAFSLSPDLGLDTRIHVFPNGKTHIINLNYDKQNVYWYAQDETSKKFREIKIPFSARYMDLFAGASITNTNLTNYIISIQTEQKAYMNFYSVSDDDNSFMQCFGAADTSFIKQEQLQVSLSTWSWQSVTSDDIILSDRLLSVSGINVTANYVCGSNFVSTDFKIVGPDKICNTDAAVFYKVPSFQKAEWQLEPSIYKSLEKLNDSTVSILFSNPDTIKSVKLYAAYGACVRKVDSITITLIPKNNSLPKELTICNTNIELKASPWFKSYLWQDGSVDSVYTVTKPGKYIVRMETYCNTISIDSTYITGAANSIVRSISVCERDTISFRVPDDVVNYTLLPENNVVYALNNFVKIYPPVTGSYILNGTTSNGCAIRDSIEIKVHKTAIMELGGDIELCRGDKIILNPGNDFTSQLWSTGATTNTLKVESPGMYGLWAKDINGCAVGDTIQIIYKECPETIEIPTAFTPNNDGLNDIFKPRITGPVINYHFVIYNRWAEKVFESTEINKGWDGTFNGKADKTAVYIWVCQFQFNGGKKEARKGHVVLIR